MKIKILKGCSGLKFSYKKGDVVDVTNEIGKDLVEGNLAEEVKTPASKPKAGAKADAES